MARIGFCGGSYLSQSPNSDAQVCKNFYVETNESGMGNSAQILVPTPGLSVFASVSGAHQARGEETINGRTFAVIDSILYEVSSNGMLTALGTVANDGAFVSMAATPQQLGVVSGGLLYIYMLAPNGPYLAGQFISIPSSTFPGPVSIVLYCDSFFIAIIASSQQYFVSNALDGTTWNPLATQQISTFADNVISAITDHREVWLFGAKQSQVNYDAGNIPNPFSTIPGGYLEQGCAAASATVQLDNGIFWIGQRNDQGGGIAWRTNGYSPIRVSTFAIETAWQSYATIADARAFSYQDQGHSFWVINFPTAQKTWVYDAAVGLWHERGFWLAAAGIYQAALPQCHTYNFGKHLVGDRQSGTIYQMAIPSAAIGGGWNFVTDNGALIRRERAAPHVSTEQQWMAGGVLQVYCETGLGPQPPLLDGAGNPRDPEMTLYKSYDGGHTFVGGRSVGCGQAGNFRARAMFRRLGRWRDMVFKIAVSDPIPWKLIDAYLTAAPGFEPQERVPKQYGKVA